MPRGRAQARHPRMFSCPIRVHSWFKHCLDYAFLHIRVHSCPFVVQTSIWTTFVSIRVHSWFSLSPPLVFFVVQTLLGLRFFAYSCPFVSIRGSNQYLDYVSVNSWFSLFPLLRVFSCFSCFSWFDSPFSCLMRRAQARHPRTTLSSLLPSPFSLLPICPFFTLFNEIDVK